MGLCGEKTKPIQSQSPAFGRKSEVRISTTPVLFRMTVARCCPGNPKQIEWVAKVAGADTIPISTNFKGCDMTFMNKNVAGTMLLVAIADPQPNVRNLMSVMISSFTVMKISMTSPQTGFPTLP